MAAPDKWSNDDKTDIELPKFSWYGYTFNMVGDDGYKLHRTYVLRSTFEPKQFAVFTTWGGWRGTGRKSKPKFFDTLEEASAEAERRMKTNQRRGYKPIDPTMNSGLADFKTKWFDTGKWYDLPAPLVDGTAWVMKEPYGSALDAGEVITVTQDIRPNGGPDWSLKTHNKSGTEFYLNLEFLLNSAEQVEKPPTFTSIEDAEAWMKAKQDPEPEPQESGVGGFTTMEEATNWLIAN